MRSITPTNVSLAALAIAGAFGMVIWQPERIQIFLVAGVLAFAALLAVWGASVQGSIANLARRRDGLAPAPVRVSRR